MKACQCSIREPLMHVLEPFIHKSALTNQSINLNPVAISTIFQPSIHTTNLFPHMPEVAQHDSHGGPSGHALFALAERSGGTTCLVDPLLLGENRTAKPRVMKIY